jgi:hypothetical protein
MSSNRQSTITTIVYLSLINMLLIFNFLLLIGYWDNDLISAPHDVDKTANNHTFICTTTFAEMFNHTKRVDLQQGVDPDNTLHKVIEIDGSGNILWEIAGLAYPHEVEILPNGHLLIADTGFNRVIEVNYPNKEIVWSWEPSKINWTEVNPFWDEDHYYNNEIVYDWTHLNDVDFKNYSTWDACLISLRNFDLIVEVNYTAEKLGPENNPENIVWWYGDYGNHSMLFKQHNPDYLENGNIMICDSLNNRVIEINKTTKELVWFYDEGMRWPRDADMLPDGNILITDSFNNRVFKLDKYTKSITWKFNRNIIIPYESDQLPNGNVLISGEYSGLVYEVDPNGRIVWQFGASIEKSIVILSSVFFILMFSYSAGVSIQKLRSKKLNKSKKIIRICLLIVLLFLIFAWLFLVFGYSKVISAVVRRVYPIIGSEMF